MAPTELSAVGQADPAAVAARRRRRVLIVVQNSPVPADRRVWNEAGALHDAGYEVAVIAPRAPGQPGRLRLEGIDVFTYRPSPAADSMASYAVETMVAWLWTAVLSVRVALTLGFDVLQACNPPDTFFALGWLWRLVGKRFVFDQHDLCPELHDARFAAPESLGRRLLVVLERLTYASADHVVVTNESIRQVGHDRGRLPAEQMTVVRNGPRPGRMRRGEPDATLRRGRDHLVVWAGTMGFQDGVDNAVRAIDHIVHEVGRDDCTFAFLGDGDARPLVESLVAELGLGPWVELTGWVGDDVLDRYLSTADLGLCPDPKNPLNDHSTMIKTMEYMSYGLPVVAYDLIETRVSAGEAAVFAGEGDPVALAGAVVDLLDDPGERARRGAFGRRRIEDELAWERQVPAYLAVFDRLLDVPGGRG